jgi:hypothetical protein
MNLILAGDVTIIQVTYFFFALAINSLMEHPPQQLSEAAQRYASTFYQTISSYLPQNPDAKLIISCSSQRQRSKSWNSQPYSDSFPSRLDGDSGETVGIVDLDRCLSLIQYSTKLYLVNYDTLA